MKNIETIAVAGAGTMGSGIAQVCASFGYNVILYDIQSTMLEKAKLAIYSSLQYLLDKDKLNVEEVALIESKIIYTSQIEHLKADLIFEAIIERLDLKHQFFKAVAAINPIDTILASNTSSIPITQIAAGIPNPERVLGIHFFNPAVIMKLVEIISGAHTDPKVANNCKSIIEAMGKTCVMAKDAPGFIVNRVARHYYVESLKVLEEKVASFEDIDVLMESSGFKMGPFRLMDLIGVDTNFSVTSSIYKLFYGDSKFRPSRIQQQKVDAGFHGKKTGKGFYEYNSK
jgi:3-hydroxybutyryl-CoA dehydrogenase